MTRPRLLDAFCGGGGIAVGYWRAGYMPEGVDTNAAALLALLLSGLAQ